MKALIPDGGISIRIRNFIEQIHGSLTHWAIRGAGGAVWNPSCFGNCREASFNMSRLVYLRESDEYVGPFATREDAERFLTLMLSSGESLEDIDLVEIDIVATSALNVVSVKERKELIEKGKRLRRRRHE